MITVDENAVQLNENNSSNEGDVQDKINMLKESVSIGEIPEDLKNFIMSLQHPDGDVDEVSDEELLADEVEGEILDGDVGPDIEDSSYAVSLDSSDVSVDDLDDIF